MFLVHHLVVQKSWPGWKIQSAVFHCINWASIEILSLNSTFVLSCVPKLNFWGPIFQNANVCSSFSQVLYFWNCTFLFITKITVYPPPQKIAHHPMQAISFASGGDPVRFYSVSCTNPVVDKHVRCSSHVVYRGEIVLVCLLLVCCHFSIKLLLTSDLITFLYFEPRFDLRSFSFTSIYCSL